MQVGIHLYANVSKAFQYGPERDGAAQSIGNRAPLFQPQRAASRAPRMWSDPMSLMNDLKKYAVAKMKERRHRQVVSFLNSLPREIRKDIGWNGDLDRYPH